jgi:uncharacterized protein (UPF0276 family)
MRFAINYSKQGAHLWQQGLIQVDCFKCPAWKNLIDELKGHYPLYVHFPLRVGKGIGDAINTETKDRPDWKLFEQIANQTQTPYINIHLAPIPQDHEDIPVYELDSSYSEHLTRYMIKDLKAVVQHLGAEKVIAENIYSAWGAHPIAAVIPEVARDVIEDADCGLLLDISHARQAARELQMDPKDYIQKLPLHRLREIHITGIQVLDANWIDKLQNAGISFNKYQKYYNHPIDHLPMIEQDWIFFQWALNQIFEGQWHAPDVIAFEYGGIGKGFFQATTDAGVLVKQVPRLYRMVHRADH